MAGKCPILLDNNQLHRHFLSVLISIENQTKIKKISWNFFADSGNVKTCDELDLSEESMLVGFSFWRRVFQFFSFLFFEIALENCKFTWINANLTEFSWRSCLKGQRFCVYLFLPCSRHELSGADWRFGLVWPVKKLSDSKIY